MVRWILLDVAVALLAVGLLGLAGLSLWRRVKALGKAVGIAGEQIAQVTAQLDGLQDRNRSPVPAPAGHQSRAPQAPSGVRSPHPSGGV